VRSLAVSGSLGAAPSYTTLLRVAARLTPAEGVKVALYKELADLPHFDPDLDDPDGGRAAPPLFHAKPATPLLKGSTGVAEE
jgi:hypothetical protein